MVTSSFKMVDKFKYLRSVVQSNEDIDANVTHKLGKVWQNRGRLVGFFVINVVLIKLM